MILLSALLASLTGLVSGERPVERAQVEASAYAALAKAGEAAAIVRRRPVQPLPSAAALPCDNLPAGRAPSPASPFALAAFKQSWLE